MLILKEVTLTWWNVFLKNYFKMLHQSTQNCETLCIFFVNCKSLYLLLSTIPEWAMSTSQNKTLRQIWFTVESIVFLSEQHTCTVRKREFISLQPYSNINSTNNRTSVIHFPFRFHRRRWQFSTWWILINWRGACSQLGNRCSSLRQLFTSGRLHGDCWLSAVLWRTDNKCVFPGLERGPRMARPRTPCLHASHATPTSSYSGDKKHNSPQIWIFVNALLAKWRSEKIGARHNSPPERSCSVVLIVNDGQKSLVCKQSTNFTIFDSMFKAPHSLPVIRNFLP